MVERTVIEWADHTFNPWEGCQKVGLGCDHCYAETRNARFAGGTPLNFGPGAPRRRTSAANWQTPLRWQADAAAFLAAHGRRQRVFCASLADVFDNAVYSEWRADLALLILKTPDLDWLLLTKRIGNAAAMLEAMFGDQVPANVWLGATIVNQAEADRDVPKLLATPAARHFLSMEPLLGPVDLRRIRNAAEPGGPLNGLTGYQALTSAGGKGVGYYFAEDDEPIARLDWVIVGGESGRDARPMHFTWVRSLRDQCAAAGVPFLFKQWGEWAPICAMSEELTDSLYRPAPLSNPDAIRRCKVDQLVLHNDGEIFALNAKSEQVAAGSRLMFQQGFDGMTMFAVGKKRAGRVLDGVTHDGKPA